MTYFSAIRDPRIERNKLYPLHEAIVITMLAVIALARAGKTLELVGNLQFPTNFR
jgi:hypothetical protein